MSQIMKSFFALFMVLIFVVISSSLLGAFMTVMTAQNMHSQIVNSIEDSDFDSDVIEACVNQAVDRGYEIELTSYYEDSSSESYHECDKRISMMKVDLAFCISVGIFDIADNHVISGYAR